MDYRICQLLNYDCSRKYEIFRQLMAQRDISVEVLVEYIRSYQFLIIMFHFRNEAEWLERLARYLASRHWRVKLSVILSLDHRLGIYNNHFLLRVKEIEKNFSEGRADELAAAVVKNLQRAAIARRQEAERRSRR